MIIQKYKPEFIFKFKNEVEIDKNYFDEIKEMMNHLFLMLNLMTKHWLEEKHLFLNLSTKICILICTNHQIILLLIEV